MVIEQILVPIVVPVVTAVLAWFFARKKNSRDLKSMELDNEIKSAKYYQGLLDDMSKRLDNAIDQLMVSEDRNQKLTQRIREVLAVNIQLVEELQKFKQLNGKSK